VRLAIGGIHVSHGLCSIWTTTCLVQMLSPTETCEVKISNVINLYEHADEQRQCRS
jgi:hypothetical protein